MRRYLIVLAGAAALSACSSSSTPAANGDEQGSEVIRRQKDCADPQWKAENLGIWYTVCRENKAL